MLIFLVVYLNAVGMNVHMKSKGTVMHYILCSVLLFSNQSLPESK